MDIKLIYKRKTSKITSVDFWNKKDIQDKKLNLDVIINNVMISYLK